MKYETYAEYDPRAVAQTQPAFLTVWSGLGTYHDDLVLLGGLVPQFICRHPVSATALPRPATLDVDFGVALGASAGQYGSLSTDLRAQGFKPSQTYPGRFEKTVTGFTLYVDFLVEDGNQPRGTRMVAAEPPPAAPQIVAEPPLPAPATPETQRLVANAEATLPRVGPDKMGLGLIWETADGRSKKGIDLDLYVAVRGVANGQECSFRKMDVPNRRTPMIRLLDDVRDARGLNTNGSPKQAFEFVEINREVAPEDVTVFVNIYANGTSTPIRALFRLETSGGTTFTQVIEFPATSGDHGECRNRASSRNWRRVSLAELVAKAESLAAFANAK